MVKKFTRGVKFTSSTIGLLKNATPFKTFTNEPKKWTECEIQKKKLVNRTIVLHKQFANERTWIENCMGGSGIRRLIKIISLEGFGFLARGKKERKIKWSRIFAGRWVDKSFYCRWYRGFFTSIICIWIEFSIIYFLSFQTSLFFCMHIIYM